MWNEAQNHQGAFNFITGMGGFLQSILFGYAGLRLTIEKLTANPIMPPGISNFTLKGLDYLGCSFDVNIQSSTVQINWISGGGCDQLDVLPDAKEMPKSAAGRIIFPRGPFTIQKKIPSSCPLPEETLAVKSAGSANSSTSAFLTLLALLKSLVQL